MQMSRMYHNTDKLKQAHQYRVAGQQCADAGYPGLARVNMEMAAWLDPWFGRNEDHQ